MSGHAEHWDKAEIAGSLEHRDCTITYWLKGQKLAKAVVHQDLEGLRAEVEFERVMAKNRAGDRAGKGPKTPPPRDQIAIAGL